MVNESLYQRLSKIGSFSVIDGKETLELTPFNAVAYQDAVKRGSVNEVAQLADIMSNTNLMTGFGALRDEGQILPHFLMQDAYAFMDLLFNIDPLVLQQFPGDRRKIGYIAPGEEKYDSGPELWKSSWYYSITDKNLITNKSASEISGPKRGYQLGWPNPDTTTRFMDPRRLVLDQTGARLVGGIMRSLKKEERAFFRYASDWVIPKVHKGLDLLGRLGLSGLMHGCYGMEPDHFLKGIFLDIEGNGYGTTRLLQYYTGEKGKVGDVIAGRHQDTSLGAVIDLRMDQSALPLRERTSGEENNFASCLEVEVTPDTWVPAVIGKNTYSFNVGWLLVQYARALEENGIISTRSELLPTFHRVVRRNLNLERSVLVHFPDGNPNATIGNKTFQQVSEMDFLHRVGHL